MKKPFTIEVKVISRTGFFLYPVECPTPLCDLAGRVYNKSPCANRNGHAHCRGFESYDKKKGIINCSVNWSDGIMGIGETTSL